MSSVSPLSLLGLVPQSNTDAAQGAGATDPAAFLEALLAAMLNAVDQSMRAAPDAAVGQNDVTNVGTSARPEVDCPTPSRCKSGAGIDVAPSGALAAAPLFCGLH